MSGTEMRVYTVSVVYDIIHGKEEEGGEPDERIITEDRRETEENEIAVTVPVETDRCEVIQYALHNLGVITNEDEYNDDLEMVEIDYGSCHVVWEFDAVRKDLTNVCKLPFFDECPMEQAARLTIRRDG